MTKNEIKRKMYRDCHKVGYLHLGLVDDIAKQKLRNKRGMTKEQFRRRMLEDKNG